MLIENALKHDNIVLIEQFIDGTEVSCGVGIIDNNITFPVTEIVSKMISLILMQNIKDFQKK